MNKNSIWWRLTKPAFGLTVVGLFVFLGWRHGHWDLPLSAMIAIWVALLIPNLYLTGFSLWHWKYRYRGTHPVAWAAAFPVFWSYGPSLFYYAYHISVDRKGEKQYSEDNRDEKQSILPGRFNTLRSVSFVVGGWMIGWASLAAVLTIISYWVVFDVWNECLTANIGKTLTAKEVVALHEAVGVNRILIGTMTVATMVATLGSLLFAASHSWSWRRREQAEKMAAVSSPAGLPATENISTLDTDTIRSHAITKREIILILILISAIACFTAFISNLRHSRFFDDELFKPADEIEIVAAADCLGQGRELKFDDIGVLKIFLKHGGYTKHYIEKKDANRILGHKLLYSVEKRQPILWVDVDLPDHIRCSQTGTNQQTTTPPYQ
jgi:hypothetical protein